MEEWKTYKLGDLCNIHRGASPRPIQKFLSDKGQPWVKISDATSDSSRFISTTKEFIIEDGIKHSVIVTPGTLIVSNSATPGLPKIMKIEACVHDGWLIIDQIRDCVLKEYLYYSFINIRRNLSNQANGSVFQNLKTEIVKNFEIKIPSLSKQRLIVDVLSSIEDKIDLNNRINHNLEEQAQIVFDRIFNSDLTNNCLLSSIVDINPKRTLRKNEVARCIDMTYLNTAGSFPSGWEFKPYSGGMKFINGDTLMARITPCLENGKVAYINFLDKEETAFGSTEYIVFHAKEGYPNEMFYFLTRNKAFIEFATKNMNGSSGRQRVSGETIGNYIIPVLSEDDINELKTVSESTMKEILKNNLESRVLSEMRNAILPKLMSGELKINDLTC